MIAGYITAQFVHLARVRRVGDETRLTDRATYLNRDFSDFYAILRHHYHEVFGGYDRAVFGVAGPVIGNEVRATNLPWVLNGDHIREQFDIPRVLLVNDLVASARGLFEIGSDRFYTINQGRPVDNGNLGLLAAGTGLGEALVFWDGARYHPYASEGGHCDFAPGNQVETELREYIYSSRPIVEVEDVLSRRGIETIYHFIVETEGAAPADWLRATDDPSSAIIEHALAGTDTVSSRAVDIFIDCLATEAANLALKGMTLGGMYLGGSIAPQLMTLLDHGRFMERFVRKGKMESLLTNMPVNLILDDKTALKGAAAMVQEL